MRILPLLLEMALKKIQNVCAIRRRGRRRKEGGGGG
jgi:hypothetical protein